MMSCDLSQACARLRAQEPVAFPTETVYGLGALAHDLAAVGRVFAYKGRPSDNPLIVHISDLAMLDQVARPPSALARLLMDHFWPGPLTLVLERHRSIPDIVTAGLDTVAVRMPRHPLALALIELAGPLVAPSANLSGSPSPTTAAHVRADFGLALMVLDGGPCDIGLESTVVAPAQDHLLMLRPGQISAEALEAVAGVPVRQPSLRPDRAPPSPGMKYRHYAPRARVDWLPALPHGAHLPADTMALVTTRADLRGEHVVALTNLEALAQQLYARFREADDLGCHTLLVEPLAGEQGLAQALRNRIQKAIAR